AGTDNGLYMLDQLGASRKAFERVELGLPSFPDAQIEVGALTEDQEGSLWIGTANGLVRRLADGRMVHYTPTEPERVRFVRALLAYLIGTLWIGHSSGLIVLSPEQAATFTHAERFTRRPLASAAAAPNLDDTSVALPSSPGASRAFATTEAGGSHAVR